MARATSLFILKKRKGDLSEKREKEKEAKREKKKNPPWGMVLRAIHRLLTFMVEKMFCGALRGKKYVVVIKAKKESKK